MKATVSISSGLYATTDSVSTKFFDVVASREVPHATAHVKYGAVDDWDLIEEPDEAAIFSRVLREHYQLRVVSNIECCLTNLPEELGLDLMKEAEDLLIGTVSANKVTSMLLKAPLKQVRSIKRLATQCLANGLGTVGNILDQVVEAQPELNRIASVWLSLPEEHFKMLKGGRQSIWRSAVKNDVVLRTVNSDQPSTIELHWASLALDSNLSPQERGSLSEISKAFIKALFPQLREGRSEFATNNDDDNDFETLDGKPPISATPSHEVFEQVKKQVSAIISAVSAGEDIKARHYLTELVEKQTAALGGDDFAVKSLCNIAQQSGEMFRTDFEHECLRIAVELKPNDAWTLIQLADHYKRVGRFDDAIETLARAEHGEPIIAKSLHADVLLEMGDIEGALNTYAQIPGGEADPRVRTARANVLRRLGDLDRASVEYERLIEEGLASDVVIAGKAEIAKRRGHLQLARELYEGILSEADSPLNSAMIYRFGLANVLLRQGDLKQAYQHLDDAVHLRPFSRQARVYRAAVAGLLGNAAQAIKELPLLGRTAAFNEWINDYVRGLLLLMLRRHADARNVLEKQAEGELLDKNAIGTIRLGAAVSFLRNKAGVSEARRILQNLPEMKDLFADAIREAFLFHVAVAERNAVEAARLKSRVCAVNDNDLNELVVAIENNDWSLANDLEIRTLLRIAS